MTSQAEYILGTTQEELDRLGFQHRVWSADAFRLWERAGFRAGQHILDLGCGPGFASFDLGEIAGPHGCVTGIDKSEGYIAHAKSKAGHLALGNMDFRQADFSGMDFPDNHFDAAWCRWVFSWITNVEEVVHKVARVLKPGGAFAVQEYLHWGTFSIHPERPEVRKMIEACRESWRLMDSEIDIAAFLPGIFERAGLEVTHIAPLERTARAGSLTWQWPTGFLHIYAHQLIAHGLLREEDRETYLRVLSEVEHDPNAFLVTPLMMEVVGVKK